MMKISVEASKPKSMEGIDYRGYRHIIPTQAAWAYVNDININYISIENKIIHFDMNFGG